ncbi:MAG: hypothetical protein KGV51_02115 [Moraxellaceae bacterium]|nr:hypothetical protein [Moraxellaceae bacterium]
MCYELQISTNAPLDLTTLSKYKTYFEKLGNSYIDKPHIELRYKYCYRLAMVFPNNCSCGFRIYDEQLINEWGIEYYLNEYLQEEPNDSKFLDTLWLFQIIKNLVNQGYKVDSYVDEGYCFYDDVTADRKRIIQVNKINKKDFAFFESTYFNYQ